MKKKAYFVWEHKEVGWEQNKTSQENAKTRRDKGEDKQEDKGGRQESGRSSTYTKAPRKSQQEATKEDHVNFRSPAGSDGPLRPLLRQVQPSTTPPGEWRALQVKFSPVAPN